MDVQQFLAHEKQKFIHQGKEEREKYFSSSRKSGKERNQTVVDEISGCVVQKIYSL